MNNARPLIEVKDLANMLASRIDALCAQILPNGRREQHEWKVGSPAGEAGKSMAVHLSGSKAGVWKDFSSGEAGDALDLISVCLFAGDKRSAISYAKSWLGIDGLDPNRLEQERRKAEKAAKRRDVQAKAEREKLQSQARRIWHTSQADIVNSPVHLYLSGRSIDVTRLPKVPGSLRYTPTCYCSEVKGPLPAMVATVVNSAGVQIAVHRTYLEHLADGSVGKAKLERAKMVLGGYVGGFIPLSRGASGRSFKDAPADDQVILCEGIEDGLSLAMALPDYRILAAISISNFQNIELPKNIGTVLIAADNDGNNQQAVKAIDSATTRFLKEGRKVYIARSPVGKDFNDYLQHLMLAKEARA